MCYWGCEGLNTTYMCKWCGVRFCTNCGRGAYVGVSANPTRCRVCNQPRFRGKCVDCVVRRKTNRTDARAKKTSSEKNDGKLKKNRAYIEPFFQGPKQCQS
ncbi:hypothetical protein LSAT2_007527 [Lamellibrachia satsuma]|nr:hypothetical protein LSAT2_007527 [Lamellibrachia satsuma]